MSPQEIAQLKKRILTASVYYGKPLSVDVIDMYVEFLIDLSFTDVMEAIRAYCVNGKNRFMFNAAQIRELVFPEPDQDSVAREISSRITQSITKFGWCNSAAAKDYIGEIGWEVVNRKGGWANICQNHGITIDPTVFEAQTRELAKVQIVCGKNPTYENLLQATSYGKLKLIPQENEALKIEERRAELLRQADSFKKDNE